MMRATQAAARLASGLALWLAAAAAVGSDAPPRAPPQAPALRCGWFDNPTPGNATLRDRDGEWIIGMQGGHRATGHWPRFGRGQWVPTGHGSAGYGCACMKVRADAASQEVQAIVSARAQALSVCRADPVLTALEPENPLP